MMRCPCGERFDSHDPAGSYVHRGHIYAAQSRRRDSSLMKFAEKRPYADPEAAARKLLEIVLAKDIDVGQYAYTGVTNTSFLQAGGSVAEYTAGRDYAIAQGWFEIDRSGTRIVLLRAGADV
jgi:hypothetical protein